jgi:hypothetical protein
MLRKGSARSTSLGFAVAVLFRLHSAQAEPAATPAPPSALPAASSKPNVAGFGVLVAVGYGASTTSVRGMTLAPYGATFGLDAGFTFRSGLHLGAYGTYSLGSTTNEHREPILGKSFDFEADTSNVTAGLSVGWDVPVTCLVLRYGMGLGFTSMKWDFGGVDAADVRYGDAKNPSTGFQFTPGATVLWPYGKFQGGVGFDYVVQANGTIPSGFIGKLVAGVKL